MDGMLKDPKPMTVLCKDGSFEITPKTEFAKFIIEGRNKLFRAGALASFTVDEALKALEEDRAGYNGWGKLWNKSEDTSTQA